ncbi:MAG: DUF4982 domain-containing protein [Prevotella sp.]|nr:DUF4982 domain-containing protein [Prevotella sp.]
MKKPQHFFFSVALAALMLVSASVTVSAERKVMNLKTWEFSRDQAQWETVQVPHDWAIAGPFDKKWDLQVVRIEQNGEKKATEKSGRSGSLPWIGKGWYRTTVNLTKNEAEECAAVLQFDGAMAEPKVFLNGEEIGGWAYGYNAFRLNVTNLLKEGENKIEVALQNLEESSRWYPGAGLYRPVQLVLTDPVNIDPWTTYVRTTRLGDGVDNHGRTEQQAVIDYETHIQGVRGEGADVRKGVACVVEILDKQGVFQTGSHFDLPADGIITTQLTLSKPNLWSPEAPYLYKVRTRLFRNNKLIDETLTPLGVRTVEVTSEGGFMLNGKTRKIKGVCLHHDLGPLGAAVNEAALIRQIKLMKEMGCDAIRTSHNMPSTMQMDLCDSLGMMVMAESFDMWIYPKCKNGYARLFKEWAQWDITNLVLNHRNHPSIVMWSIGNEIPEQGDKNAGVEWSQKLQDLCHKLDPSRPVTQGFDRADAAMGSGVMQIMDIPGLNYRTNKYDKAYKNTTKGFILGTETASTVSSRGVYKLPYKVNNRAVYKDGQCSGYDNEWCPWSNLPDVDFENMDDLPYTIGQFVWTGIDYLGEPTPYDEYWPSRSSYFGICDLAGLPKDRYYLYRSVWNKDEHTLHIAPHWTWGKAMVGKVVPVQVYSDYDEAELFVNGKSQGRIRKNKLVNRDPQGNQLTGTEVTAPNRGSWDTPGNTAVQPNLDRYRLRWMNVKYQPGELKVVAYDKDGKTAKTEVIRTAGPAAKLKLEPWTAGKDLKADGNDLCYITVTMTDKNGNMCPTASDQLTFSVEGEGTFKCVCNGDATSLEQFTKPTMKLFNGQLVLTVQSTTTPGTMTVKVTNGKGITETIAIATK